MDAFEKYHDFLIGLTLSNDQIESMKKMWNQEWRFYHNQSHLEDILSKLESKDYIDDEYFEDPESVDMVDDNACLITAAFFHDIVYNPKSPNNEEDSVEIYKQMVGKNFVSQKVIDIIMATKSRTRPDKKICRIFWDIDNNILKGDIKTLIDYESKIMKEFQFVDYSIYKEKRIEFLESNIGKFDNDDNINFLIKYLESYRPKVGFYPGSFNPLHKGHEAVIKRAEQIFDKVIIGVGVNPDKNSDSNPFEDLKQKCLSKVDWRQIIEYHGLTTDTIDSLSKDCDVTLIRGLRNGADLDYEMDQLRFMEDITSDYVDVIYLPCDKDYDYISSTRIRKMIMGGYEQHIDKYLP